MTTPNEIYAADRRLLPTTPCSRSSESPETDRAEIDHPAVAAQTGMVKVGFARTLERDFRKLHAAYKQKVMGEIQLGKYDKGALALLAEIQRDHPTLSENTLL